MRQTLGLFAIALLLPTALFIFCQQSYQLTLGKTYFSEALNLERSERISTAADSSSVRTVQGVYGKEQIGERELPVVSQFDRATGKQLIWLADSLSVVKGSWVRIKGTLSTKQLAFGPTNESMRLFVLKVEACELLSDLNPLVAETQQEYRKIRNRLQKSITPARSKLQLPEQPHWQMTVDSQAKRAIVSMNINDLMYEAEIDFVYKIRDAQLLSVYAVELFKGE